MDRIQKLRSFLVQQPNDSFLQHALALEYIKIGDDISAKKLFENILQYNHQYIGSYYHLAKLLERIGQTEQAIICYEKGMKVAKQLGDQHTYSELKAAFEEAFE